MRAAAPSGAPRILVQPRERKRGGEGAAHNRSLRRAEPEMRSNLIAGLDIGTAKTCAVIAETSSDPRRPALKSVEIGEPLGVRLVGPIEPKLLDLRL